MCGITGIVSFSGEPVDGGVLQQMTRTLAHRGPDGEGLWTEGPVGLGHRRLAILDLSEAAAQPMHSACGRYVITYNGELYNYPELKKELEDLGHVFRSQSDTEAALLAYAQWGEKAVARFNGMFALAIWDQQNRELFLARDRYGQKPLYVWQKDGLLLFASENKALLAHPAVPREPDTEALAEYFTFQNIFTRRTLLKNVWLFPPGSWARVTLGGGPQPVKPVCYWDFHFHEPAAAKDEREYLEELDRLFTQAVMRQLLSDVEVGSYLSGGMDSGSISAVAARHLPYIKTFTGGFDLTSASGLELAYDERPKAERMSYLFKTEHYEMVLKAGDMERVIPPLAWHLEEPRVGQSYPNYYVARLAGKFVKVALSGAGGDELFGGYPWRYYHAVTTAGFEDYIHRYYGFWQRLLPDNLRPQVFAPVWAQVRGVDPKAIFRQVFRHGADTLTQPQDYIHHSMYFEAKTFLHGLLVVGDKLSMAHGLEERFPFLDNDLVDFAQSLPVSLKLQNLSQAVRLNENEPGPKSARYYRETGDGKVLLRKLLSRYVPQDISEGAKQGFSAPDASWFKGESIDYVRQLLLGEKARLWDFLDRATVTGLVNEHLSGQKNRRLFIWSLLNVEWWLRLYLHGEPMPTGGGLA